MSFSLEVKNELARLMSNTPCCYKAELASLMRMGGTMLIGGNKNLGITFRTENAAVARKVLTLIKQGFELKTEIVVTRGRRLKKNNSYQVKVVPVPGVAKLLTELGIIQGDSINITTDSALLRKRCCRRSYLRGAFLGGGSVNKPEGDYHLELVTSNEDFAKNLVKVMRALRLTAKITERKNDYIVYLKGGEAITSFLRYIGAHMALMEFENVRIMKDMRNQINRIVNCETANLEKTVNASMRQTEKINFLASAMGLDKLPVALAETAEVRLKHPEATLQELVEILNNKVTKSGLNHRLRKLEKIADDLMGEG